MEKGLTGNKLKIIAILSMHNQKIHFAKPTFRFRKVVQLHILKLWTANLKHYIRGNKCYDDIVRMAKKIPIYLTVRNT